jgi:hypothetical protein
VDDILTKGDQIVVDDTLHLTVTRVEVVDGQPRIYGIEHLTGRTSTPIVAEPQPTELGPFTPQQVWPQNSAKRQAWRERYPK